MLYLKELISELPHNCLFDKGKIGCGGTTMAIESDIPYVIAVPFGELVTNKTKQYPNNRYPYPIFGVKEGVTIEDVVNYLAAVSVPKIITTYDSLAKVAEALGEKISEINLLVDEYHILFTQYAFRESAVTTVLQWYKKFKGYTFMTGTPLESDFVLDELKHLPIIVQEWPVTELFTVNVRLVRCHDVMASSVKLIMRFLSGAESGNLYLFVNSVSVINKLVKYAELAPDNCRVIYSKHNGKTISYKKDGAWITIPNSTVDDMPRKINFLTSTVFEGCDIFDPEGKTVVLSDPFFKNTLMDISTSINQIAGRIRDSCYIGEIIHLYKESEYRDLSYDGFKGFIQEQTDQAEKFVAFYDLISDEEIKSIITTEKNRYLCKAGDKIIFNKNLPKIDLFKYKVENEYTTTVTLSDEYVAQNSTVELDKDISFFVDLYRLNKGAGIDRTFKEVVQEIRGSRSAKRMRLIKDAEVFYPFLGDAINRLGFERIESLHYVQKKIKDELLRISDASTEEKVSTKLNYNIGYFYSYKTIKLDLRKAYDALGYNQRAAKATDLEKYYYVKKHKKRMDGKQIEGYIIMAPRF